ncbi:hypothetical protein CHU98_g4043 [Xylaria longipes]|nr:hypothetical protein CHU98_g4043 [Xylaria longipes]
MMDPDDTIDVWYDNLSAIGKDMNKVDKHIAKLEYKISLALEFDPTVRNSYDMILDIERVLKPIGDWALTQIGDRGSPLEVPRQDNGGGVVQVLEDVKTYTDIKTASRPDLEKEHEYIFRIADIREELAMIREIVSQQLDILNKLIGDFEYHNPESLPFLDRRDLT